MSIRLSIRRTVRRAFPPGAVAARDRPLRNAAALAAVIGSGVLARDAFAVSTRTFTLEGLDELSGGDLKGVAVGSDGVVRAGFTLGNVAIADATAIFASLPLADGSVLVGTSPTGKVYKVQGDQVSLYADTGQLAVTSLVQGGAGLVYAATIPDGKIFRLTGGGGAKADLFATLPDVEDVWALAMDKGKANLFAATGPQGKLYRISAAGSASVYFASDEPHLVSLAVDEATGDVWAGSSGKGILYRVTGPGRASVVYDFAGEEVKAIAFAKGGFVFAIANEYGEAPEPPRRNPNAGRTPAGPVTVPRPKPGKGVLYRFDSAGRAEKMMHHDDFHYTALTVDAAGTPYVGTGAEGRVYTVDDAHAVTLLADTEERQVGALPPAATATATTSAIPTSRAVEKRGAAGDVGLGYVTSSDPAVFHRVLGRGGPDAVWTSKVLDAQLRAKFGHISFRGTGPLEVGTRTGNTGSPDPTWSPWSSGLADGGLVASPTGRFIQVRARFRGDATATLRELRLPFLTENVRPVVLEVSAVQKGAIRDSKDGILAIGSEPPKHDSTVKISWKVENPDNDTLRYRLFFRRDGQAARRDILGRDEVVAKLEYDWDTQALPEGKYRIVVEASDETSNPPDQVQRHSLESPTVVIDNTPPVIAGLAVQGRRLKARLSDTLGPIARAEVAVDARTDFRPLAPADGLFDTANETLDADVASLLPAGSHIVTLRVFDAAGNATVQEAESP